MWRKYLMGTFPKKEGDVLALAEMMIAGYTAHSADFPSVEVAALTTALTNYKTQKQTQENAQSQAEIATVTKDGKLSSLVETMRNDLKISEVDTASNPEKLTEIGWAPRPTPQPIQPPTSPTNLHPIGTGEGTITLSWERPTGGGGRVRNYLAERREQQSGGTFGNWTLAGTSYTTEITLTGQPSNIRMEYRVKAINTSGESMPGNTVSVVLP